jgi:hypothetical protein
MAEARRQLFSIGAFFITIVIAIVLYAAGVMDWTLIVPVVFVLFGIWMMALAAMRGANPQKYERSSFSTSIKGLLLIAVGGAWYLFSFNWLYSLALILVVLAGLAIVAAFRHK